MISDHIRNKLKEEISDYLRTSCNNSISSSWRRTYSDEDSLTAAFLQSIAKGTSIFSNKGTRWEWGIEFSTTAGRGPDPLESVIGADAVFFIEIKLPKNKYYRKGILIQSKITDNIERGSLEEQINKMETYSPNCSVVFAFKKNEFKAVTGPEYLKNKNKRITNYSKNICDFIADDFMECKYGVENLYYNFENNEVMFHDLEKQNIRFVPQRGVSKIQIRKLD